MLDELANRIWQTEKFHQDTTALLTKHVQATLLGERQAHLPEEQVSRLLRAAIILASSKSEQHQSIAYQIATSATQLEKQNFDAIPYILHIVLSRLGNFPAIKFAASQYEISPFRLPTRIAAEASLRLDANTIELRGQLITFTDFQMNLWHELLNQKNVSISAPTSSGKSFVLQAFTRERLLSGQAKNVAFVVPTRALINEISSDISAWLKDISEPIELITTPMPEDTQLPDSAIYVVTQERLHLLLASHNDLSFDIVSVDEAQSIGDGPRGVLLSSVIEEIITRNSRCQLLFAGPNIANPKQMGDIFRIGISPVSTKTSPVSQNLIFVDCDDVESKKAVLSLLVRGEKIPIGQIETDQPLFDHRSKLINIPRSVGGGGQNLIYAMGAAECEEIAFGLADEDITISDGYRQELSEFIKEAVHPKFSLGSTVLNGIGFHYGRLPSLVRKAVEDAFARGHLTSLVTTSTLLYGVNLPARNLFLHNPSKGKDQPISPIDFWNLAGRAGRLGKEFEGNIFLIDYGTWKSDPISGEKERKIIPSLQSHILDETEPLIRYIQDDTAVPHRQKQDEFENTFVKLYKDFLNGKLDETLKNSGLSASDSRYAAIFSALKAASQKSTLPLDVFTESPTVSVYRQQSLYDRLLNSIKRRGPAYVIPRHPLDGNAYPSLLAAFRRCHGEILRYPRSDKSDRYYSQIALRWMKGDPLPQIIDASFDYKKDQNQNPNIATVIRTTLTEIENDLRFKYVRLMSCYNAVLRYALKNTNNARLLNSIPSIPIYLEVGACSTTMMSFMGLGLSRFTSAKLRRLPRRTDMSQEQARAWIKAQEIDTLNLPAASTDEIRRVIL